MKITVIGGSQGTGAQVVAQGLAAGHQLTVLSRRGTPVAGAHVLAGDARDLASVAAAVAGADAVVVAVGGARGVRRQRAAVTRTVIAAMQEQQVRRLVVQSSLGAGNSGQQLPAPLRLLMRVVLATALADHNDQEAAVMASGLDWTVLRPGGLSNKPATGHWQALAVGDAGTLSGQVTRSDLAACVLAVLPDPGTIGQALGVSS